MNAAAIDQARIASRSAELTGEGLDRVHVRVDRLFAVLLIVQWIFAVACALIISPQVWIGELAASDPRLGVAVAIGGVLTVVSVGLAIWRPGRTSTRHLIVVAQALYSALFIHLMGGRSETHFHVFGSLAFIAFYRDWRVLVTGTAVVIADHYVRGSYWPESLYGVTTAQPWRFLEFAGWVVFEDVVLIHSCLIGVRDVAATARERALLEATNASIEAQIAERTRELMRSEGMFRNIVRTAREGIWLIDHEIRTTFVNQRMGEMLGYSPEEMQGRSMHAFMDEEGIREAERFFDLRKLGSGEPHDIRFVHRSGRNVWTILSANQMNDDAGTFNGALALVTDITDRREWESRIRSDHADTELLVSSIKSVLISVDGEGRVCRWNEVATATFGLRAHEVEGRTLESLNLRWDGEAVAATTTACLESGQAGHIEVRFIRAGGIEGFLDLMVCPSPQVCSSTRRTEIGLRYLLLGTDITERKAMAAQYAQGQKLESVGHLAAGVAHEINTPTQFIGDNLRFLADAFRGFSSALEAHRAVVAVHASGGDVAAAMSEAAAAEQRADMDYIREEAPKAIVQALEGVDRVASILQALNEFSHPDSHLMQHVDLARCIQSTLIVARNEYKYVADLVTEFDPELPPVCCVSGELNQVVLNLVVNASHAIGDLVGKDGGRGRITVGVRRHGDQAEITVADTGGGIPEAIRDKIFDPFFTTKPVGKGTGQGLYIAREIVVRKHQGTIDLASVPGSGTTFTIRIPIAGAGADKP